MAKRRRDVAFQNVAVEIATLAAAHGLQEILHMRARTPRLSLGMFHVLRAFFFLSHEYLIAVAIHGEVAFAAEKDNTDVMLVVLQRHVALGPCDESAHFKHLLAIAVLEGR